jgi:hypothetical protein
MSRGAVALLAVAAFLVLAVPGAEGQTPSPSTADTAAGGIVSADAQIAPPAESLAPGQDEPQVDGTGAGRSDGDPRAGSDGGVGGEAGEGDAEGADEETALVRRKPSDLNAALLPERQKQRVAQDQCVRRRLIGAMPEVGRQPVTGASGFPWVMIGLGLAALGTILAALAVGLRRRRQAQTRGSSPNLLDILGATIGILGGLAALAGQFYGVGYKERPAPEALVTVREVYARIPRDEYRHAMGQKRVGEADGRELGNVIWLQLDLTGYAEQRTMWLNYASYGAAAGAGELPKTAAGLKLRIPRNDHQRAFLPVWVGLPKVKFQVQLRLVDPHTRAVRARTSTGRMRGEQRRYACNET